MIENKNNSGFRSKGLYNIAVFLDYENPEKGIIKRYGNEHFEYGYVEMYLYSLGEVKVLKAYAPFEYFKIAGEKLKVYGFETTNTPKTHYKLKKNNTTDLQMAVDIIDTYHTHPEIHLYIFITGDIDFLPALKKVKENPKNKVYIISEREALNCDYHKFADKIVDYHTIKKLFDIK